MAIRFLYFDLGNVILTFSHEQAWRQIGEVAGVSSDLVRQVVGDNGLQNRFERGELSTAEFYRIFCEETQSSPALPDLMRAASEIFALNVPVVPIVAHLRAAGYPLGILSNTCEPHWAYCNSGRYRVVSALFDQYVLSYQIGAMKPEAKIYQVAIDRAGVAPDEIFFTDDRGENVEGARHCGLDAVLYESPRQLIAELAGRGVRFNL